MDQNCERASPNITLALPRLDLGAPLEVTEMQRAGFERLLA
jgi:hypothetical protein